MDLPGLDGRRPARLMHDCSRGRKLDGNRAQLNTLKQLQGWREANLMYLRVLAIRLSLLSIEGVHRALHEHVRQGQVLQALHTPGIASFIIILEGLHIMLSVR